MIKHNPVFCIYSCVTMTGSPGVQLVNWINKAKLDSSPASLLPGERERARIHGLLMREREKESGRGRAGLCVIVVLVLLVVCMCVGAGGETLQCLASCISASPTVRDAFTANACLLRVHLTRETEMKSSGN